jgi:hypothetical protein
LIKKLLIGTSIIILLGAANGFALDRMAMPQEWNPLSSILIARLEQTEPKMKLNTFQVNALLNYLNYKKASEFPQILILQKQMPKVALELLFAVEARGLSITEAEKMAAYLQQVPKVYHIRKIAVFDEHTSHIIGREWHEIDYSGEGMTWQGQKAKYAKDGITNFKSLENMQKFFPVESKLPYFKEIYY